MLIPCLLKVAVIAEPAVGVELRAFAGPRLAASARKPGSQKVEEL